jgi:uncharacterized Tic20 family protein
MREKPGREMRFWAMLCHLSGLLAWMLLFFLVFLGLPLYLPLNVLAPLLIWQYKKSQYPWIDFQGKESLNFQISFTVYTLIIIVIVISLSLLVTSFGVAVTSNGNADKFSTTLNSLVVLFLFLTSLILVSQSFLVTFAAIRAYNGQHYRYPLTIRVLR